MRAVIQRVLEASVTVEGKECAAIGQGLVIFLGVSSDDEIRDLEFVLKKISGLRVFEDQDGKMNLSISEVSGEFLVVSQFTLFGDVRKGFRPSFTQAASPEKGNQYYSTFIDRLRDMGHSVKTGIFGADMKVRLINDGPVTILIDSDINKKERTA